MSSTFDAIDANGRWLLLLCEPSRSRISFAMPTQSVWYSESLLHAAWIVIETGNSPAGSDLACAAMNSSDRRQSTSTSSSARVQRAGGARPAGFFLVGGINSPRGCCEEHAGLERRRLARRAAEEGEASEA